MTGNVYVNNQRVDKPGKLVGLDADIVIRQVEIPYVSRGGLKLKKALSHFGIEVNGKVAIDVGASTGGFTECLLMNGASYVYAVDVGYGQLDWKLRNDKRVAVFERTNIRYVQPQQFDREIQLATVDVSFISLDKVIPVIASLLKADGDIIALVKPQFEAGQQKVGKGGVVKDPQTHKQVLQNICSLAIKTGLNIKGLTYSPIKGPAGNIEYLIWLRKGSGDMELLEKAPKTFSKSFIDKLSPQLGNHSLQSQDSGKVLYSGADAPSTLCSSFSKARSFFQKLDFQSSIIDEVISEAHSFFKQP